MFILIYVYEVRICKLMLCCKGTYTEKKGFVLVTSVQLLWTVARLVFVFFYLYMSTNSILNSETASYVVLMNLAWALCTEMFEFIPFL